MELETAGVKGEVFETRKLLEKITLRNEAVEQTMMAHDKNVSKLRKGHRSLRRGFKEEVVAQLWRIKNCWWDVGTITHHAHGLGWLKQEAEDNDGQCDYEKAAE